MLLRALFFMAISSVSGEHRGWQVIGPGGGGAQFNPMVSPADPKRVLVNSDMTGAYLTEDGGASWRMLNFGSPVRFFAFDQERPSVVYAQTTRLWRSEDGGREWKPIYPRDARITIDGDHGEENVSSAEPAVDALAAADGVVWAAMGNTLQRSTDGGVKWKTTDNLPGKAQRVYLDSGVVYVMGSDYVAIGGSKTLAVYRHPRRPASAAGFTDGKPTFYSGGEGLYVSTDGEHWGKTPLEGTVRAIGACLRQGKAAYASYRASTFGVAATADGGETWVKGWEETDDKRSPSVDVNGWLSERYGPGWGEEPLGLAVAPGDPAQAWATDTGGTLATKDSGKTWVAAYTRRQDDGSYSSTGLDVTTTYGVHIDPFDPAHMFIGYTDIGLFMSGNGGKSWSSATRNGIPPNWGNTTYWMVFDPEVKGRVWAAMSGTHDLPRPKVWHNAAPSTYKGGVVRSDDGGRTWRAMTNGMRPTAATHIVLDRGSLYVTGFGRGIYRSDNGGMKWSLKNTGLPDEDEPFVWRLATSSDGALYVVIAREEENGAPGQAGGSLYRSLDRAESWEKVNLPEGVNGPNGLAVDPVDPKRLYLAAWAKEGGRNGGIFLSTDRGGSWRRVLDRDQHVYDVTIDPRRPNVLYACGFESSAWRSTDRGVTWSLLAGYDFKWGHRVIPDAADAGKVYVTTFGGSVWHGPVE